MGIEIHEASDDRRRMISRATIDRLSDAELGGYVRSVVGERELNLEPFEYLILKPATGDMPREGRPSIFRDRR